jgi:hypothetical protein
MWSCVSECRKARKVFINYQNNLTKLKFRFHSSDEIVLEFRYEAELKLASVNWNDALLNIFFVLEILVLFYN